MGDLNHELLSDAVQRNLVAVLSLPSAGMFRHYKSRLLAGDERGIWLETVLTERPLIEELISTKKPVGISFKSGVQRANFAAIALALDAEYRINADICVPAMLIERPSGVKAVQRRSHYRIALYSGCPLTARIWRIAPMANLIDRPVQAQELAVNLRDISVGGIGVIISGADGQPPKVGTEDRLRIELRYNEEVVLLEGKMRPPFGSQPPNGISAGICFKELERDFDGRRKLTQLTRITGEMQREEMRRTRLGLT